MYRIVGADGKEYGPVTADGVREWITQGRANGRTMVSYENGPWQTLSSIPEFAPILSTLPPAQANAPAQGTIPSSTSQQFSKVSNYMVTAVIVNICCCPPLGAPALIYSAQVNVKAAQGDYAGAEEASRQAKKWVILGAILGILTNGAYIAYTVMQIMQGGGFPKP
ncbi:MAG: CD225/dispanin family protein [Verrucomicrobiota bacterium]|nr:CD225/dispanin family protein [Verrucomicrobiota bacterium]